jgi:hypothetical protein
MFHVDHFRRCFSLVILFICLIPSALAQIAFGNKQDSLAQRIESTSGILKLDAIQNFSEVYTDVRPEQVLNGTEVFAQVSQIIGQQPFFEKGALQIRFRESNTWTQIVGTNGYAQGHMFNFTSDSIQSDGRARKAGTSWFAYSDEISTQRAPFLGR